MSYLNYIKNQKIEVSVREPIKNAYEGRLALFRKENRPEKVKAATGWIPARMEV